MPTCKIYCHDLIKMSTRCVKTFCTRWSLTRRLEWHLEHGLWKKSRKIWLTRLEDVLLTYHVCWVKLKITNFSSSSIIRKDDFSFVLSNISCKMLYSTLESEIIRTPRATISELIFSSKSKQLVKRMCNQMDWIKIFFHALAKIFTFRYFLQFYAALKLNNNKWVNLFDITW